MRLVPLLVAAGHEVAGMTRSPGKLELLRDLGAEPFACDVFDLAALREAVVALSSSLQDPRRNPHSRDRGEWSALSQRKPLPPIGCAR